MKKTSTGRTLDANLEMSPSWKCCPLFVRSSSIPMPRPMNSSGVYRPNKKKARFSLVSISVYPRSRQGAERTRQSEGRWSCPLKTALERSYLTANSSSENCILRPRRQKASDRTPPQKNDHICQSNKHFHAIDITALSF